MARRLTALAAVVLTGLATGCGVLSGGLQNAELPGGADVGDDPYQVTVQFADVLDLVPQSLVKVNDVPVGAVRDIVVAPDTWNALVTVELNGDVELPANATARVRNTSLLGEKFVELAAPVAEPPAGRLTEGAMIPLVRSGTATEVEQVLGALSMLLNGGGVAQVRTIAAELNAALEGNEPEITALLGDLDRLVSGLDARKTEITRALDGLNRLGATLAAQRGDIATALDGLGPGLAVLADQRTQLVGMLQALDRLSVVATDVVNRSRDDVLADLELLRPTLQQLAASGADLPNALELLATFPFTDDGVRTALKGDYANLYVRADLDLVTILRNILQSNAGPAVPLLPEGIVEEQPPPGDGPLGPLLGPVVGAQPSSFPLLGGQDVDPPASDGLGGLLGATLGGGS